MTPRCRSLETEVQRCQRAVSSCEAPEGEAEVQENIIVSDAVEGTHVDLDCKSRREQAEERSSRRETEAPGKGGEEIKIRKRK